MWLWPSTNDFIAGSTFRGIQAGLRGSGLRIVIDTAPRSDWDEVLLEEEEFLVNVSQDETCAGVLIWAVGGQQIAPALRQCAERGLPLVFLDRCPPEGIDGDVVCTENRSSARKVVQHLVDLGHREIGCLANADIASSAQERVQGFRRAIAESNLDADNARIAHYNPWDDEAEAETLRRVLGPMLTGSNRVTALFCINDHLALAAIEAAESFGLRVPDDLTVVGFDGVLRWVPGGGNLTSAHQDFYRIGEIAAELLIERLAQSDPQCPKRHVLLEAPLVVRNTSGPPPEVATAGVPASKGDKPL